MKAPPVFAVATLFSAAELAPPKDHEVRWSRHGRGAQAFSRLLR